MKETFGKNSGFTLIELVIVIVVLGILAFIAIPKLGGIVESTQISTTKDELLKIKEAIVGENGYWVDVGSYPTSLEDLVTMPQGVSAYDRFTGIGWNGPYISDDGTGIYLQDAWENDYVFTDSTVVSYGPDGVSGGGDDITMVY